ncbi:Uncharacterised protein [Salmonella enterica]|uniref:Uncharacterized protein n=1 Tax=Salmonella enterica TaxID=28901 RepID=A0A379QZZ3_SALER|nr:Uncharacterised protein [Salmonella enterica subsp. salamae]SUF70584.1 Uncharacterised protein [Salmonella enterica]
MFLSEADAPPVNRFSDFPLGEGETIIARKDRRIFFGYRHENTDAYLD